MDPYIKHYVEQLSKLSGCKIIAPIVDSSDPTFFGLVIESPSGNRQALWFLQDEEGNGPGSFQIDVLEKGAVK